MWFSWIRTRYGKKTRSSRPQPGRSVRALRFRPAVEPLEDRQLLAIFIVNTLADVVDPADKVVSLREAITSANTSAGVDTINFSFLNVGIGGIQTIRLTSTLPTIATAEPVVIDGTKIEGFGGTPTITADKPLIELDGGGTVVNGLVISSALFPVGPIFPPPELPAGTDVRGLIFNNFTGDAIVLQNSRETQISTCFIGTDATGLTVGKSNGGNGISIIDSTNNTIGGLTSTTGNVISGNLGHGVSISGASYRNQIVGNRIGTDRTGTLDLGNTKDGVNVNVTPNVVQFRNLVGGLADGATNIIAFNRNAVVVESGSEGAAIVSNSIYTNDTASIVYTAPVTAALPPSVIIQSVSTIGDTTTISGTLSAVPSSTVQVQIFKSNTNGVGGVSQGQTLIGTATIDPRDGVINPTEMTFTITTTIPLGGSFLTATATMQDVTSPFTTPVPVPLPPIVAAGADAGGAPLVQVYDATTRSLVGSFLAYDAAFTGGVRVAVGDVNGDGTADIVTGPGAGGIPFVRVFSGKDFSPLTTGSLGGFLAFDSKFAGGVYVAAGDLNGDGFDDVIVGADAGGVPAVRALSGRDGTELTLFSAFDNAFTGGVRVAAGDVDNNGVDEIIAGAGPGGGPLVRIFDGNGQVLIGGGFLAYDLSVGTGVYVASGDVNNDGFDEIITGLGNGFLPANTDLNTAVRVFQYQLGIVFTLSSFNPSQLPTTTPGGSTGGLTPRIVPDPPALVSSVAPNQVTQQFVVFSGFRVGTVNSASGGAAQILTARGPGGSSNIQFINFVPNGISQIVAPDITAFAGFPGGVFVGGS